MSAKIKIFLLSQERHGARALALLIATLAICMQLLSTIVAARTLELTEHAHELTLADIRFPTSVVSNLVFQSCADCVVRSVRVNTDTVYLAPTGPLPLPEFLTLVAEMRAAGAAETTFVTVFRSVADDGSVTRIMLHLED